MYLEVTPVLLRAVLVKGRFPPPVPSGVVRGEKGIMPVEWAVAFIYVLMIYPYLRCESPFREAKNVTAFFSIRAKTADGIF